ncbi:MAG TPA: hypothetical protein ACHBX0_14540 [Arsenophonus sp.]
MSNKSKESNTSQSAAFEGRLIIHGKKKQKQAVNDLSRDTANVHQKLDIIFDKEKEQKRLAQN